MFDDNVSMAIQCEQINSLTATIAMKPNAICFMCAFIDGYWLKLEIHTSAYYYLACNELGFIF